MGTGSFGGGSGGFGTAGSGSIGGVPSTSTKRSLTRKKKKTDSLLDRIVGLIGLTRAMNDNPALAVARKTISEALQSPVRQRYVREILSDPFVDGLFRDLFDTAPALGSPPDPSRLGSGLGLQPSTFTLAQVVAALVNRRKSREVDERYLEITRCALSDIFLMTVDNNYRAYAQLPARSLPAFDTRPFQSICGHFLSSVIREVVRRDVLELSPDAQASVQQATREIADRWVDIFERKFHDGKSVRHRDMLKMITQNYPTFSRSEPTS